jgi:hypothetical protein
MLREAYTTRDAWEVVRDLGQTLLRKRVLNGDENQTQVLLEKWVRGIKPVEFLKLFETIEETQTQWNEHCKRCDLILREEDERDQVDIFATHIKSPGFFLAGRVFVDARYLLRDPKKDQYIAIFSSNGNEDIASEY